MKTISFMSDDTYVDEFNQPLKRIARIPSSAIKTRKLMKRPLSRCIDACRG